MVITEVLEKGKSIVDSTSHILYNIGKDGGGVVRELHGVIYSDNQSIGFVSYDYVRSGVQLTISSENSLSIADKKAIFNVFLDDVEQLLSVDD